MIHFLEIFSEHVNDTPERPAVADRGGDRITSYEELDDVSGRIASWLKIKGIGREDIVAIRFNRGMEFIAARLAVMKAGAAWVGIEEMMGKERMDYIIKDSGSVLTLDEKTCSEAMQESPLPREQWTDPDPHNLAFIVYTSGSTGNPKGAMHEYGIYDNIIGGTRRMNGEYVPAAFGNIIPESFVGGIYFTVAALSTGSVIHELPLSLVRDHEGLLSYFDKHRINITFMPPTLAKALISTGRLKLSVLHVGGEIVSDVFSKDFDIKNIYGPTEFGYPACIFKLDRAYDNTPVGEPLSGTEWMLMTDDGEKSDTEGILCVRLPYFRGYLNSDNKDTFIIKDNIRYFNTNDLARFERRVLTILGRVDDMIKLNGNRIDPSEVERAVMKVTGAEFSVCRSYVRGGVKYLCVYVPEDFEKNREEVMIELKKILPEYMLPSCFMKIKSLPRNDNGKIERDALPEPDIGDILSKYAEPENDVQRKLCRLFKELLEIDGREIGIDDSFFLLGGSSLLAMRLLIEAGIPELSFRMIYENQTVRNISAAISETTSGGDKAEPFPSEGYPLTDEELWFLDRQLRHPDRLVCNQPIVIRFKGEIDINRLKEAILSAADSHPVLRGVIKKDRGEWRLHYDPSVLRDIEVIYPPEEGVEDYILDLPRPQSFDGSPLNDIKILCCKDIVLLLIDLSHVICDGTSFRIIAEDILTLYKGGKREADDGFSDFRKKRLSLRKSDEWKEGQDYFKKHYRDFNRSLPDYDISDGDPGLGEYEMVLKLRPTDYLHAARILDISSNTLFLLASAITLMAANRKMSCLLTWTWNGRSDITVLHTAGLLTMDLPVELHINGDTRVKELSFEAAAQINSGIANGTLSPFMKKASPEMPCFIYEGDMWANPAEDLVEEIYVLFSDRWAALEPLEISIWEDKGGIRLELSYDSALYSEKKMEELAQIYIAVLKELLKENAADTRVEDIIRLSSEKTV